MLHIGKEKDLDLDSDSRFQITAEYNRWFSAQRLHGIHPQLSSQLDGKMPTITVSSCFAEVL